LENQPDIFELYKRYDFDSLKEVLQQWLEPESEEEDDEDEVKATITKPTNYSLDKAAKKTKVDEFDNLFGDDEDDDLPF
jgi:hypothetical protein